MAPPSQPMGDLPTRVGFPAGDGTCGIIACDLEAAKIVRKRCCELNHRRGGMAGIRRLQIAKSTRGDFAVQGGSGGPRSMLAVTPYYYLTVC
jgi:hypothetical protein